LLDEGPLEDVERRLGLDGQYVMTGAGTLEPTSIASEGDIVSFEAEHQRWTLTVNGKPDETLAAALEANLTLTSWAPVRPNLVEWLCAATGMDVDDITLEVASSAMLPMQSKEVLESE
jgi:hypothetical protein